MKSLPVVFRIVIIALSIVCVGNAVAQESGKTTSKQITLQYISPNDLIDANIMKGDSISTTSGMVIVKINSSTNAVLLMGSESSIQYASNMISFLDVPPKQIVIEVKIIEVNNQKIENIGIDWQQILANTSIPFQYSYNRYSSNANGNNNGSSSESDNYTSSSTGSPVYTNTNGEQSINNQSSSYNQLNNSNMTNVGISNNMRISTFLNILEGSDGVKVLNIPKIVTINNRKGTILDGSKIFYVDKYASYSNLFQTQELKTGLFLSVTPTLGSSGYVKMNVEAKLTTLNNVNNDLRPIEVGQMLENIVVVKEGQSIILGGLKKTSTEKVDNSIPILGSILPFLFSSQKSVDVTNDVLLILTPTVVDLTKMEIPDTLNVK